MVVNQISAFEYVSILVSIILGLGITQIISSFTDLLYHYKEIKFYWPHTLWVLLGKAWSQQILLVIFFIVVTYMSLKKIEHEWLHKCVVVLVSIACILSVILEKNTWVMK